MKLRNISYGKRNPRIEVHCHGFVKRVGKLKDDNWPGSVSFSLQESIVQFSFHMPIADAKALVNELNQAIAEASQKGGD